jgi:hypothetical protein
VYTGSRQAKFTALETANGIPPFSTLAWPDCGGRAGPGLREPPVIVQRVNQHAPQQLALTIINVAEELTGWYTKGRRAK